MLAAHNGMSGTAFASKTKTMLIDATTALQALITPNTNLHIPVAEQQLGTARSSLADGDGELLPRR